ncbi:MAG: hypothetical protein LC655_00240 [Bacteroidales bacterium]|nr:hypothetical protein [Bacteroidales bacterium]
MSYSKISSTTLVVVAAISLIVILFFYASPRTVDIIELEARVEQLLTEGVLVDKPEPPPSAEIDTIAEDRLELAEDVALEAEEAAEEDSAAIAATAEEQMPIVEVAPEEVDLKDHLSNWELMVYKRTDYALGWAYILLAIAAIAAILFPLVKIVTDVKAILRLLMVVAAAAVLLLVSYFVFASDTSINILGYTGTDNTDPVTLKWIGTGLFSTYIIFGVAILSILYFEVASIFK